MIAAAVEADVPSLAEAREIIAELSSADPHQDRRGPNLWGQHARASLVASFTSGIAGAKRRSERQSRRPWSNGQT
ncbi:hypothetical protein [Bradyrhizobium japonicum]|uniref:hypothetical protein n=1 Tax=Bradyrhizobium japonicum TaxID=375 RepID=UPI001E2A09E4|nr:hypothetical protein [Bradyrhizobium japonicum]MCD9825257.1 hypothetical protein [Bradyrhizobium japonicum]MCD9898276.1 hypothetical protein [Bradyrhizobium japonicum]MEB2671233.1 hypothetical protein [Bradyrhizobium japonicum]WLB28537.1 hypothetical protein QIH85_43200 [Bradyrhizobium japonicum]WRI90548.1 hypothetical protein R3F75_06370 [Bradyrhizobium japonicum]